MTRRVRLIAIWTITILVAFAGLALMLVNSSRGGDSFTPHSPVSLGYATVGILILMRRSHRIGAMFLGFGAFTSVTGFLIQGCAAFDPTGSTVSICGDGSRVASLLWPVSYLFFGSLFLFFPSGHLPSRRWLPLAIVFFGSWGSAAVGGLLMGSRWTEQTLGFVIPVAVWSLAAVAVSPIFRFRRADTVERLQLRWLSSVIALSLVLLAVGAGLDLAGQDPLTEAIFLIVLANALVGVPAAITVAILRYRLYDIDVIVNRALVYVLLSGGIAVAYLASVVVLQRVLSPVTADSDIAVAGSTLAAAALFRPMRSHLQTFIDHRFYRRRYDAVKTVEAFASRLRDEIDLRSLGHELKLVVSDTMQPAHVSLWLRSEGRVGV